MQLRSESAFRRMGIPLKLEKLYAITHGPNHRFPDGNDPFQMMTVCWRKAANWRLLDTHFNWDRFTQQVAQAIESQASPALSEVGLGKRLHLRWLELRAPYAIWPRPRHLARVLGYYLRQALVAEGKAR